jgi:hypothetical protein
MSYYTELVSLASIHKTVRQRVQSELDNPPRYATEGVAMFVALIAIRESGTVCFKSKGHPFWSDYDIDDEDGLFEALNAPWCDPEEIASWLAPYATKGSSLIFHSLELDGNDFAFEFDGKGRFRCLELRPISGWKKPLELPILSLPEKKAKTSKRRIKDAKRVLRIIAKDAEPHT